MSSIGRLDQQTLVNILSFADDTRAAPVCRGFRAATYEAMKRVVSELAIVRNDQVAGQQDVEIELPYHKFTETVQQILPQATPEASKRLRALVRRVAALKDEAILGAWQLIDSPELFSFFAQQHREPTQPHLTRTLMQNVLIGGVLEDIARHELAKILRKTLENQPQLRGREGLERLHETQAEAVAFSLEQTEKFLECSKERLGSFSASRFIEQERIVQSAELEKDVDMFTFWEEMMRQFGSLHIPIAEPGATPDGIRAWLRIQAHVPILDRVTHFRATGLRHLPREIGRLRNLKTLQCHGGVGNQKLLTLPEELGTLRHLTWIDLQKNLFATLPPVIFQLRELRTLGFGANLLQDLPNEIAELHYLATIQLWNNRFEAIPEILMQLPHLQFIGMRNLPNYTSRNDIHELPNFLTRNRRSPTIELLDNPIQVLPDPQFRHNESPFSVARRDLRNVAHLDLTRENLTHIPFRLWFKEHCLIPFFSLSRGEDTAEDCLKFWAQLVLNTPVFLINLTLYEVVEPLITLGRDFFGYDRLVPVQD